MIKLGQLQILTLILLSAFSCTGNIKKFKVRDYYKSGFLNEDTFQLSINEFPDKKSQGLVEKRESALAKAKDNLKTELYNKLYYYLSEYYKRNYLKIDMNRPDVRKRLIQFINDSFIPYGYFAEEFYHADCSVMLIYLVHKKGLRRELESLQ